MSLIEQKLEMTNLTIKNRLAMPPIATYKTNDGLVGQELIDYYNARSEGGNIGLLVTEHSYICEQGKMSKGQVSVARDDVVSDLKKLTSVIKKNGTKTICQINHAGSAANPEITGMEIVGPSPIALPRTPMPANPIVPHELTKDEIKEIIKCFADAARRVKEGGYDGVEIHSAHGYLLNQFYSPLTNKREDEYGGSLDKRLNIHREVIRAVRKEVGPNYFVSIRLGGSDYMEGGSTIEDAVYACKVFEDEGVNLISLTGGMCRYTRVDNTEPGYFKDMSKAVKKVVKIPVLLTGGVKKIEEAEDLLNEGAADIIGVGRELLKDPKWADKAFNK